MWIFCLFHLLVVAVLYSSVGAMGDNELDVLVLNREKRNSLQLCDMINRYTNKPCVAYAAYGCFCGLRSWGSNPKDSADRCCRQHDQCFANIGSGLPLLTYSYTCSGSSCRCTDQNTASNQYRSCTCDVQLAQCLRSASYNVLYNFYNRRNCR